MNLDIPQLTIYVVSGLVVAYAEHARRHRERMWRMVTRLDRRLLRLEIQAGIAVGADGAERD